MSTIGGHLGRFPIQEKTVQFQIEVKLLADRTKGPNEYVLDVKIK